MQYKTWVIPVLDKEDAENELNAFLRGHNILKVERELVKSEHGIRFN